MAQVRGGEHAKATAEAELLEKDARITNDGRYNLACIYGLALKAIGPEPIPTTIDRYAGRAFDLLQKLQSNGFFQAPAHANLLASDKDLMALRGRNEFQQLLK